MSSMGTDDPAAIPVLLSTLADELGKDWIVGYLSLLKSNFSPACCRFSTSAKTPKK